MGRKPRNAAEASWPKLVLKKWFNIRTRSFDYRADDRREVEDQTYLDQDDDEEVCGCQGDEERGMAKTHVENHDESASYRLRRTNSETLRAQYIKTKELRIWVGTWNAGGRVPSDDMAMEEWLDLEEPADIYVIGIQEIVPLNAGNVLGAEDSRPVTKWEHLIRETLNRINLRKPKYKCYSDPPSPSRFESAEDAALDVDEFISETDSDTAPDDDKLFCCNVDNDQNPTNPVNIDSTSYSSGTTDIMRLHNLDQQKSFAKRLERLNHFSFADCELKSAASPQEKLLGRTFNTSEKIVMAWPEQPLDLMAKRTLNTLNSVKSFRVTNSFRLEDHNTYEALSEIRNFATELELSITKCRRKRVEYVRIVSKQMVGIFLSIWVRRSLWKHVQNVKVSTVGVGVMGYIGNKGSISVSMSIYQTLFCFVCSHLSSGEKPGDELRRNADVQEIHRRTQFSSVGYTGLSRRIHDHERIFWFGDLNYRIDLAYDKTHALISKKEWSNLIESDQLKRELKKGRTFDGWSEGVLSFPPTYKYEFNSTNYVRDDGKGGRRNPAWCDRIISFGEGTRILNYKRAELKLSDHRPVMATYMAEVEIFCHKKLQKALTLTDAELEHGDIISDFNSNLSINKACL